MSNKIAKRFPTLGQRILAAIHSYQLGHTGVDRVLKEDYHDKPVGSFWEKKGEELLKELIAINEQSFQEIGIESKAIAANVVPEKNQYDTKAEIMKVLDLFLKEVATGAFIHIAQHYTRSNTGVPGLVIYMASCPDNVAEQLHAELDESGNRILAEHGIHPIRKQ